MKTVRRIKGIAPDWEKEWFMPNDLLVAILHGEFPPRDFLGKKVNIQIRVVEIMSNGKKQLKERLNENPTD